MENKLIRRIIHPLYRRLETKVHPLRYLFMEITQRCNLNCLHCGSDCGRNAKTNELSTAEWLSFFAYLEKNLDTRRFVLVLTGGEPLCAPDLRTLLMGINHHGLSWGMVSNAWALNPTNLSLLLKHGMSSMTISLDGLKQTHDWLRRRRSCREW